MSDRRLLLSPPTNSRPAAPTTSRGSPCRPAASPGFPGQQSRGPNVDHPEQSRSPQQRRRELLAQEPSFDVDFSDLGLRLSVVVGPAKGEFAAFGRGGEEGNKRVRSDCRE